ncbi:MAG: hypothetical protein LBC59_08580, partial [Chitinispirillales bacterium]|nr:hypothetical protein [Chitinispirillales bacterium]
MESGWVIKKNRISMRLLVTLLLAAGAAFWSSGCSKKLVQEPGSEIYGAAGTSVAGTFTDKRDGARYATVEIAGKTWMAVNLNYKADSSWCYNNRISNCNKYGRL